MNRAIKKKLDFTVKPLLTVDNGRGRTCKKLTFANVKINNPESSDIFRAFKMILDRKKNIVFY